MSIYGKEKIYFLISRLLDEREVTSTGKPIALHPMNDLNNNYSKMDFIQLTDKLEKEHKAIKLLNKVPTDQTYDKYEIELLPDFDKYVQELQKDPKYREWAGIENEPEAKQKSNPLSVNHARKNGVMTGKEKLQAVIEDINDKYQGLITGNVVILHSGNLGQRGLEMHEQKQALDILTKDRKVIKYTAKNEYKDRAEIHPRDQLDVFEGSMDQLEADEMFDQILEQQLYTIEVLPTFTDFADELLGDAELEYQKDVFLLRLFYNRIIGILDAVVSSGVVIEDDKLDFVYVKLTSLVENVLSKPQMRDWQKKAPELYETLLGHAEDIGEGWQYSRTEVLKHYAKLQKDWMLNSNTEFELDNKLIGLFEEVDELIAAHKKAAREASDNWYKRTDAFAKDFRKNKGKVVIDKQPKPKEDKPDDTIDEPDETSRQQPTTQIKQKVVIQTPLEPRHYSDRKGILTVTPSVDVLIAKRGKVKRKNGKKYDQCHLMSCLFKSVNTLNKGITFSKFLGVKYDKSTQNHIRKTRNTVDEINNKVADITTAKKLILLQGEKITIDKSYL